MAKILTDFSPSCFAADMPIVPQSPERSRQGSPNGMEDNRSASSGPGGGRCGNGRNGFSLDSEEVCFPFSVNIDFYIITLINFVLPTRLGKFSNNHSPSAISFRPLQLVGCPTGSGPRARISKTSAPSSWRAHFTSTVLPSNKTPMNCSNRTHPPPTTIHSTPHLPHTFCGTFSKATTYCPGCPWTRILTIACPAYPLTCRF